MGDIVLSGGSGTGGGSSGTTPPTTGVITTIPAATVDTLLLTPNPTRKQFFIFNDANKTLYIALSTAVSLTSFTLFIPSRGVYEGSLNGYVGPVHGIWSPGVIGNAHITELT